MTYHPDMDDTKYAKVYYQAGSSMGIEPWPDGWVELGSTTDDGMSVTYADELDHQQFVYASECLSAGLSFSMPASKVSGYLWLALTRRKHPRVSAMRRAYRAKQGRR